MCPGRYLSLVEMKMLLAMLLHHFELEEVRGPGGTPVREHYAFSMRPQAWKRR
jgi:cytochrome P450